MNPIIRFSDDHAFLSNFYPSEVSYLGVRYPTVEHAFQSAKWVTPENPVGCTTGSPGQAKRMGRQCALRPDWEDVKVPIMRMLLAQKFSPVLNPQLARWLVDTFPSELVEGNTWGDTFWGVCRGVGLNWLGRLLMEIRAELLQFFNNEEDE